MRVKAMTMEVDREMAETTVQYGTAAGPSFGEMLGFYAYMVAVGGGLLDRRVFSTVVRRPELIGEITRPEAEDEEDEEEGAAA
jgi:hypothetical protein